MEYAHKYYIRVAPPPAFFTLLHSSFLVCALFLVSDNNGNKFGCFRWSLHTPGASLFVGREKGSQESQNRLFPLKCKTSGAFLNTHAHKLATLLLPTVVRGVRVSAWCMRLRVRLLSYRVEDAGWCQLSLQHGLAASACIVREKRLDALGSLTTGTAMYVMPDKVDRW